MRGSPPAFGTRAQCCGRRRTTSSAARRRSPSPTAWAACCSSPCFGAATLLLEQATPAELLAGIAAHRATICFTAPTAYRVMSELAVGHDLRSLAKCVSAGETLPAATFEAFRRATGIRIIDGIGTTEMLHQFISAAEGDIRPGSTGRVVPGYRARIVDEHGREVAPGVVGRLAVCGPTGCRYLADPERQRSYVEDGWNLTGDAYSVDADGYY